MNLTRTIFPLMWLLCALTSAAQPSTEERRVSAGLEILKVVDEKGPPKRLPPTIERIRIAHARLPQLECQGILRARFRLETIEMTNSSKIAADLALSKVNRLVAERRELDSSRLEEYAPGKAMADIVSLLGAAFKGQLDASADPQYVSQAVELERLGHECMTPEYIAADNQVELATNLHRIGILASDGERLRAVMKAVTIDNIEVARTNVARKMDDQRQRSPDALKAKARIEQLKRTAETPELLSSRAALIASIRKHARSQ